MKITIGKNIFNVLSGGIAFGIWQHSFWAGIFALGLLAIISDPDDKNEEK